jgi:hypothetical protein
MKFKIGDRVRDWEDGDIGIAKSEHYNWINPDFQDGWLVLWETGEFAGQLLWLGESEMDLVENNE